MTMPQLLQEITSLPPEAQKQVSDFVAFLKTRYRTPSRIKSKGVKWEEEPFYGMWKNREDMQDGAKWVRELRQREWGMK